MALRKGVYIVPTNRWYIERTVWLIAGIFLLTGTALAALVDPRWVFLIILTGAASILVSLTGFCIVGNVLRLFGFTPMLGAEKTTRGNFYFMQTDSWYLERRIYLAVGINISVASTLSLVFSPWWLAFTGFVGAAMVWFAATGYCIMANGLYWLGAEPRLVTGGEGHLPDRRQDRRGRGGAAHAAGPRMKVKVFDRQGRLVGPVESPAVRRTDAEWRARLTQGAIRGGAGQGHRAPLLRHAARQQAGGRLRLRLLRPAALFVAGQVRVRHRLAELLPAGGRGERGHPPRHQLGHGPGGNPLRALRRAPGARLQRRPPAHRAIASA